MTATTISKDKVVEPSIGNALPHFLPIVVFPLIFAAATLGGWWLIGPFLFFITASPLDVAFGKENRNMNPKTTSESQLFVYNLPIWLWAVLWPTVLVFTVWQIFMVGQHAWWENVLLAVILAIEGQAVFIVGHELIHRRIAWERYVGEFLLASGSYPHYATEHFYIHHAYVGTPLDVGSAPKGQSFWRYFPRELTKNLTGAWSMAQKRMARRNLPVWHYSNPFWRYGIETGAWYAFFYAMGGWLIVPVYMFLCLGNVFSMKVTNYMQHYGLRRVRLPNGRFERVQPRHSWSANDRFSKWMFFNFQRHADHHMFASRYYPLLQHYEADLSPQMPAHHGTMFSLAIRPKAWFEVMDPLVDEWREHFYPQIKDWSAYDSWVSEVRPEAFDVIAEIFESAPRLARAIEKNPELLDSLKSRAFTDLEIAGGFGPDPEAEAIARSGLVRVYWFHDFGVEEMTEQLAEFPVQDAADAAEIVRNWVNDNTFQVAMHTLRGNLSPIEAGVALANIAQAAISTTLTAALEDVEDRFYQVTDAALAVVALGDLASKEVTPNLSLDLVLLQDCEPQKIDFSLGQRFIETLDILTGDSLLFVPLANDHQNFRQYNLDDWSSVLKSENDAANSIKLIRARCIFSTGDPSVQTKFDELHHQLLTNMVIRDGLITKLRESMKHSPEVVELNRMKAVDWGLSEIEKIARALQLTYLSEQSANSSACGAVSIFKEIEAAGALDSDTVEKLIRTAQLWRNLAGIQRLIMMDEFDADLLSESARAVVAQACAVANDDELNEAIVQAITVTQECQSVVPAKERS